ncbi:MAG: hypothetical protein ACJ8AI_14610 [Rhodopila sp.]
MAERTDRSIIFTFAPRTTMLTMMHAVGKLFPRGNRSPAIEPVRPKTISKHVDMHRDEWRIGRTHRVSVGFYISQALEVVKQ